MVKDVTDVAFVFLYALSKLLLSLKTKPISIKTGAVNACSAGMNARTMPSIRFLKKRFLRKRGIFSFLL